MTWMLYELARHPEYQSKMREEVRAIRARVTERGDTDFSVSDLDAMTHVLAAMKEVMRLHPIAYALLRQATRDEVLPLAYPVTTTTGEVVDEVGAQDAFVAGMMWALARRLLPGEPYTPSAARPGASGEGDQRGRWRLEECLRCAGLRVRVGAC